jgi:TonB-dependent receptor-like protein
MRLLLVLCCLSGITAAGAAQEKPQPLPAVPVTAEAELVRNAKLREFDRRRSNGIGHFITEAELEKDQSRKLSDVLQRLPGTMMVRPKKVGGFSSSAVFVVSSRGSATIEHVSPIFGRNCPVAVWLDGVPVYRGLDRSAASPAFGGPPPPGQVSEPPFDINSIMTNHVAAIEFYSGPATMPAELNVTQGTCGALVIWTK